MMAANVSSNPFPAANLLASPKLNTSGFNSGGGLRRSFVLAAETAASLLSSSSNSGSNSGSALSNTTVTASVTSQMSTSSSSSSAPSSSSVPMVSFPASRIIASIPATGLKPILIGGDSRKLINGSRIRIAQMPPTINLNGCGNVITLQSVSSTSTVAKSFNSSPTSSTVSGKVTVVPNQQLQKSSSSLPLMLPSSLPSLPPTVTPVNGKLPTVSAPNVSNIVISYIQADSSDPQSKSSTMLLSSNGEILSNSASTLKFITPDSLATYGQSGSSSTSSLSSSSSSSLTTEIKENSNPISISLTSSSSSSLSNSITSTTSSFSSSQLNSTTTTTTTTNDSNNCDGSITTSTNSSTTSTSSSGWTSGLLSRTRFFGLKTISPQLPDDIFDNEDDDEELADMDHVMLPSLSSSLQTSSFPLRTSTFSAASNLNLVSRSETSSKQSTTTSVSPTSKRASLRLLNSPEKSSRNLFKRLHNFDLSTNLSASSKTELTKPATIAAINSGSTSNVKTSPATQPPVKVVKLAKQNVGCSSTAASNKKLKLVPVTIAKSPSDALAAAAMLKKTGLLQGVNFEGQEPPKLKEPKQTKKTKQKRQKLTKPLSPQDPALVAKKAEEEAKDKLLDKLFAWQRKRTLHGSYQQQEKVLENAVKLPPKPKASKAKLLQKVTDGIKAPKKVFKLSAVTSASQHPPALLKYVTIPEHIVLEDVRILRNGRKRNFDQLTSSGGSGSSSSRSWSPSSSSGGSGSGSSNLERLTFDQPPLSKEERAAKRLEVWKRVLEDVSRVKSLVDDRRRQLMDRQQILATQCCKTAVKMIKERAQARRILNLPVPSLDAKTTKSVTTTRSLASTTPNSSITPSSTNSATAPLKAPTVLMLTTKEGGGSGGGIIGGSSAVNHHITGAVVSKVPANMATAILNVSQQFIQQQQHQASKQQTTTTQNKQKKHGPPLPLPTPLASTQPTVVTAIPVKRMTTLANGNVSGPAATTAPKMVLTLSAEQMKTLAPYLVMNNGKIAIQPNLISSAGGGGGHKITLATANSVAVGGGTLGAITTTLMPNKHAVVVKALPRTTQQQQLTKIL